MGDPGSWYSRLDRSGREPDRFCFVIIGLCIYVLRYCQSVLDAPGILLDNFPRETLW